VTNDDKGNISTRVIFRDQSLERDADESRLKLAAHRWHWTLDNRNPNRVTPTAYARSVNRSPGTIADMVAGYDEWHRSNAPVSEFGNIMARAKLRGEDREATIAVAKARGISVDSARRHRSTEVREVNATARERANRRGTRVEDEVEHVASSRAQASARRKDAEEQRKAAHTLRFMQTEGKLAGVTRTLRLVLADTAGIEFSVEERESLGEQVNALRALTNLLGVQLAGESGIDWDHEMSKLTAGDAK
jgi:hypothetical protein